MPYGGSQWYYGMSQRVSTLDENLNKIWGKHQFAFGVRIRHEHFAYLSDRSVDEVTYTNQATGIYDPTTGANYGVEAKYRQSECRLLPGSGCELQPKAERSLQYLFPAWSTTPISRTTGACPLALL